MDYHHITVSQVMTTNVFIIEPDTTLAKVAEIFAGHHFHHLPVIEEGVLVGMISKSDLLLMSNAFPLDDKERRQERNESFFEKILAGEVMTRQLVRLRPEMTIHVAAGIFLENMFHAMPVVDDEGGLVGIISSIDLLRLAYVPQKPLTATEDR